VFFRVTLDHNLTTTAILDGFTSFVDKSSVSGRGEKSRNSSAAGSNLFGKSALKPGSDTYSHIYVQLGFSMSRVTDEKSS